MSNMHVGAQSDESDSDAYGSENQAEASEEEEREFDLMGVLAEENAQLPPHLAQYCMHPEQVGLKSKSWRTTNRKRFANRKKIGYVESQKELLPPEVLR